MRLIDFIRESNRIEGITREPILHELVATQDFLELEIVTVPRLEYLANAYQPGARLRDKIGMDVRVGNHIPPPGGPRIQEALDALLMYQTIETPSLVHLRYETLHPFTDGNGRTGRALWLWMMMRHTSELPPLGFLHTWYYQSLQEGR